MPCSAWRTCSKAIVARITGTETVGPLEASLIRSVERDTPRDPLKGFLNRSVEEGGPLGTPRGSSDQKCGDGYP